MWIKQVLRRFWLICGQWQISRHYFSISGHRMIRFHWKLCTRIYNFLFCCFMLIGWQLQVTLQQQQNKKFWEVRSWSELYSFRV